MNAAAESGPVKDSGAHAVAEVVRGLHFEILPLDGIEQQVLTHLDAQTILDWIAKVRARGTDPNWIGMPGSVDRVS